MEAKSIGDAAGAEVVALGAGVSHGQRLALLGYLFWSSVSEMAVVREDLVGAVEDSGLEMRFAPVEANSRSRLFGTERRHANLLIRDVRRRGKRIVRQVVREVVDAVGATLEHKVVGQIEWSETGGIFAFP